MSRLSLVHGHSCFQSRSDGQELCLGRSTGLEVVRVCRVWNAFARPAPRVAYMRRSLPMCMGVV